MASFLKIGLFFVALSAAIAATYVDRYGLRALRVPPEALLSLAWLRTSLYALAAIGFIARRVSAPASWVLGFFCLALAAQEVESVRELVHSGVEIPLEVVNAARIVFAICVGLIAPCASFLSASFDDLAERRGLPFFPRWLVPMIAIGIWMLVGASSSPPALGREVGRFLVALSISCYAWLAKSTADRTVDLGMSSFIRADQALPRRRRRRRAG